MNMVVCMIDICVCVIGKYKHLPFLLALMLFSCGAIHRSR